MTPAKETSKAAPVAQVKAPTPKASAEPDVVVQSSKPPSQGPPNSLSYNERKEYNKLEKEIGKLGEQIATLDAKIVDASNAKQGFSVLAEWTKEANKLRESLATKELRWMELAEKDTLQ
jgi:ABC transport system ATP-binding/permease protein